MSHYIISNYLKLLHDIIDRKKLYRIDITPESRFLWAFLKIKTIIKIKQTNRPIIQKLSKKTSDV